MRVPNDLSLRLVSALVAAIGIATAMAGLFWEPSSVLDASGFYGEGLYWRDTAFVAGAALGSDLFGLCLVAPAGLWAISGRLNPSRRLVLVGANTWWLYLSTSLAFGAIAFNEAFPLYVTLMPTALLALILSLQGLELMEVPHGVPTFLVAAGMVTGLAWGVLLGVELYNDAFPPETYYTVRTTYALDLGLIAPGCVAAGLGLGSRRRWGTRLGLPLLALAALLLPMMLLQTVMQVRAGTTFGPEAAVPLGGFVIISVGAAWFLVRILRHLGQSTPEPRT